MSSTNYKVICKFEENIIKCDSSSPSYEKNALYISKALEMVRLMANPKNCEHGEKTTKVFCDCQNQFIHYY